MRSRITSEHDPGLQRIRAERIGEELLFAGTSSFGRARVFHIPEDQALLQFAHAVSGQGDTEHPFDGYYFRKLNGSGTDGAAYVGFPTQYRSSGVMTFVVTNDDKVYEKDLGRETESVAKEMKDWKPDKNWYPAED